MSTRQNGNQKRKLEDYSNIINELTEGRTVTLRGNRKMKVHKNGVNKDLLAVWLVNEDGTLPTLNNKTQGPELYSLDTIGGVAGFKYYNALFKGAIFNKNSKRYTNGAIVTLKGTNKLKGRKMMVHPRGYDKDLKTVWLVNEDGTLPTLNNGTKGPELYDLDRIYAVNDMTIGNARKYNDIQGVLSSHLSRVNENAIFNTKEGVLQYLNQNSLRSLSQVDSGFRNMVKHSYHFQPLVLKPDQRLADLYRSFPGALNIDLSQKTDIGDEELLEAMPLGFKNVRMLNMANCQRIRGAGFAPLINLTSLNMSFCVQITNVALARLTNLTNLNIHGCIGITDAGLAPLTNLTRLNMVICQQITDAGLARLTNLTSLDMAVCRQITDAGLAPLTNLTDLNMRSCIGIRDAGLARLTNLTRLNMSYCDQITDAGLAPLTNLTSLDMVVCRQITDAGLARLTNLTRLDIGGCRQITDAGLEPLTNLTNLNIHSCDKITDKCLAQFTNLTSLDMGECLNITDAGLAPLTNLTHLIIKYCKRITPAVFKNLNKLIDCDADHCSRGVADAAHAKIAENMARKRTATMEALNGGTRRKRSKKCKQSKKTRRN